MKLMHGIGDKYAKLLEKFQSLQVSLLITIRKKDSMMIPPRLC